MTDQEFRERADHALEALKASLLKAEADAGFEVEEEGGALHLVFEEPPGKFIVSPNSAARQIWISALSTSFKLDWSDATREWALAKTGEGLKKLVERLVNEQLGSQEVRLG